MASFPTFIFQPDDITIGYLEAYASESINRRFLANPLGVSEGFDPVLADPLVSLNVGSRGFSCASVMGLLTKVSVGLNMSLSVTLDFTAHDFTASGDIYVVIKASYKLGSTTTAQIITQTTAPIGGTEIGICRVTGTGTPGSGGTVDSVVFAVAPDRHTNRATADQPFGFMDGGSSESLTNLVDNFGRIPFNATTRTAGFTMIASDADQVHMLNMQAIVADQTIQLPPSSGLVDGSRIGFLSLTGLPGGFTLNLLAGVGDAIMYSGTQITNPTLLPAVRKTTGHFWILSLVKTGFGTPRWYLSNDTLPRLHGALHQAGAADEIKLDNLAAPDDNTDLDATIGRHGLLPKLSNNVLEFFNGVGAFTVPGGATSGANQYIIKAATVTTSQALLGDGEVYRVDPPPAAGLTTLTLPDGGVAAAGTIVRVFFITDAPVAPNNVLFDSVGANFLWDGASVANFTSDFRVGQFLEFTLNKPTGGTFWVVSANAGLDSHAARHAVGAEDALDVTTLAGYPGGTPADAFLREDGTFAYPVHSYFFGTYSSAPSSVYIYAGPGAVNSGDITQDVAGAFTVDEAGVYLVIVNARITSVIGTIQMNLRQPAGGGGTIMSIGASDRGTGAALSLSAILVCPASGTFDIVETATGEATGLTSTASVIRIA